MTQADFIQHLHDVNCELKEDEDGEFYQVRQRYPNSQTFKTTMPVGFNDRKMKKAAMCLLCFNLDIDRPTEINDYYEMVFEPLIIAKHLSKEKNN